MGISRIVNTDFWVDEDVLDHYSPEDKYFFLYLLTNPQTRQLGVYKLPKKIISFQTGYSPEAVAVLLERFEIKYKTIIYDHGTQEVAILNYLAHSVIRGGKPVLDCIKKDVSLVTNKNLIGRVYVHMQNRENKPAVMDILNILSEYYSDNDNDNDNDNDSIVPRIVPRIVPKKPNEQIKPYEAIVEHLNLRAGTKYKHTSKTTQRHINARLAEGYTEDDFYTVVDKKVIEWTGTERERYLRPETLFGTKFEGYLNQKIIKSKSSDPFVEMLKEMEHAEKGSSAAIVLPAPNVSNDNG